jgi:hypothetical protein
VFEVLGMLEMLGLIHPDDGKWLNKTRLVPDLYIRLNQPQHPQRPQHALGPCRRMAKNTRRRTWI